MLLLKAKLTLGFFLVLNLDIISQLMLK